MKKMLDELKDEESNLFQTIVLTPLYFIGLISVPYLDNPLVKTPLKVVVVFISVISTLIILEIELSYLLYIIVGGSIASLLFILELVGVKKYHL